MDFTNNGAGGVGGTLMAFVPMLVDRIAGPLERIGMKEWTELDYAQILFIKRSSDTIFSFFRIIKNRIPPFIVLTYSLPLLY